MNIPVVYAKTTASVSMPGGYPVPVRAGSHWLAGDPLVKANPDLFSEDPRWGLAYSGELPEICKIPPDVPIEGDAAMTSAVRSRSQAARSRATG